MSIAPAADIVHIWTDSATPNRLGWSVVAISDQDPSEVRSIQLQSLGTGWVLIDVDPA